MLVNLLTRKVPLLLTLCFTFANSSNSALHNQVTEYVIENVNIVNVLTGEVISDHELLIQNGKINSVVPKLDTKKTSSIPRKDARGGYLVPGLIDMHVHGYDQSAFELTLSHGVTHVRIMNGIPEQLEWRYLQNKGYWLASSLTVSSPIVHSSGDYPMSMRADTEDQARRLVHEFNNAGYDLIKAYGSMNSESLSALLDEASKVGIPVAKHGPHPPSGMVWEKLRGLQSMEHVEDIYQGPLNHEHDVNALPKVYTQLMELNVPITPTLNIFWQLTKISKEKEQFLNTLPDDYISPVISYEDSSNQVKRWLDSSTDMVLHNQKTLDFIMRITGDLADNDIPLLVGSDAGVLLSPYGIATINEMKLMQASGIEPITVIQAATINAAETLGLENKRGQIKAGLQADFVLVEQNPLLDVATFEKPLVVIKGGVWLNRDELAALREKAIKNRSIFSEIVTLISNY